MTAGEWALGALVLGYLALYPFKPRLALFLLLSTAIAVAILGSQPRGAESDPCLTTRTRLPGPC